MLLIHCVKEILWIISSLYICACGDYILYLIIFVDGEAFHPFVDINERIYIFVADICRSVSTCIYIVYSIDKIAIIRGKVTPLCSI